MIPSLYCSDFPEVRCCTSCHDDWDEGFDSPSDIELPSGEYVECCCAVRQWIVEYYNLIQGGSK